MAIVVKKEGREEGRCAGGKGLKSRKGMMKEVEIV